MPVEQESGCGLSAVVATARSGMSGRPAPSRPSNLVKHFGETVAVDGVSLRVPEGIVLGLLGPNGAGKTTTVRMMTTLTTPTSGTARVAGHDVVEEPDAVRRSMGLTGQAATVDELLTGRENLRLIGSLYGLSSAYIAAATDDLLERFSLDDAGDRVVKTYSGGMRRRLDLAVSLIATPPVLFLDEPTTGLDPRSRVELWEVLRELVPDGTTLLLTTQYLEEADQLADRIVVIDRGRVIAEGTPLELKDQSGQGRARGDRLRGRRPAEAERAHAHATSTRCTSTRRPPAHRPGQRPGRHDPHRRRLRRERASSSTTSASSAPASTTSSCTSPATAPRTPPTPTDETEDVTT